MAVDVLTDIEIDVPSHRVASTIVAPLMAAGMRRANRKDLARLKALMERR